MIFHAVMSYHPPSPSGLTLPSGRVALQKMADNAEASNRKEITEIMEFSAPKNVEKQTMWSISLMKGKSSDISSVYTSKQLKQSNFWQTVLFDLSV